MHIFMQSLTLTMSIIWLTCLFSRKHAHKSEGHVNNIWVSAEFNLSECALLDCDIGMVNWFLYWWWPSRQYDNSDTDDYMHGDVLWEILVIILVWILDMV